MTNKPKTGDFLPPVFLSSLQETAPGRTIDRRLILWDLRGKDRIFFPIAQPHTYRPSFLQCHTKPTPNCHAELILNCHAELVSASLLVNANLHNTIPLHTKNCHAELVSASLLVNANLHNTIPLHTQNCHAELVSASLLLVTPNPCQIVSPHQIVMPNLFQHLIYFTNKDKRINRITRS